MAVQVSVDMTSQPGWPNHKYCFLDGTITSIPHGDVRVAVYLKQKVCDMPQTIYVTAEQLQRARGPTSSEEHEWQCGDEVHVREVHDEIVGWWAATIVKIVHKPQAKTSYFVQWKGQYEDHPDVTEVDPSEMRLATVPKKTQEEEQDLQKTKSATPASGGPVAAKRRRVAVKRV